MNNTPVSLKEFHFDLSNLTFTGHDLVRPESIIAHPSGRLWVSDGRGGVTRIDPNGDQHFFSGLGGEPNGLAMTDDGSILIANIGTGTIQKLNPDGRPEAFLTEVDGLPVTCANYVFIDRKDRLWLAFSTREKEWWSAAAHPLADGYIVLLDEKGARIVGDGIFFTNEIRLDANEDYLYVAETMKSRLLRFRVQPDGSLTDKEVVGPSSLGLGAFIDGFAFDVQGNIWVTTPLRGGVGILAPDGDYHVVFEEANERALRNYTEKLENGTVERADMMAAAGKTVPFLTSVTFGGSDLCTVYVGSLAMDRLPTFRSPVPGLPMRHWKGSGRRVVKYPKINS